METPTIVLLVIANDQIREAAYSVLSQSEAVDVVAAADEPIEAVQTALAMSPDMAVISDSAGLPWLEVCNMLRLACPDCRVVLLTGPAHDDKILERAMLVGVRQVIWVQDGLDGLLDAIDKLETLQDVRETQEYIRATDPQQFPRLIAISGAKGGVGKTTIAANLGVALAKQNAGGVVVWDAYAQFGDVANLMGLHPSRVLTELADVKPDTIDDELVLSYAIHHESEADVLVTADMPVPLDHLRADTVMQIIRALRRRYRLIVADTPPTLDSISRTVFANCWRALLITMLKDASSLLDAMRMIQQLEPEYVRADAIQVVANRVARHDPVKEAEVESLTGKAVALMIPEDQSVGTANNIGKPVCQYDARTPPQRGLCCYPTRLCRPHPCLRCGRPVRSDSGVLVLVSLVRPFPYR